MKNIYDSAVFGANGQDGFFMSRYILKQKKNCFSSSVKIKYN